MTFIVDAASLSAWQACRRRFLLSSAWHPKKWRPRSLLSSCLRQAIYDISNGADPKHASKESRVRFMQTAADAGLDMEPGGDPYQLAKDCCAILDVVPRCVAKLILLTVQPAPDIKLDPDIHWHPLAWADDSGALHRWVFTDRTDADRMHSEAISWYVAGDVMLSRVPMTLHFIRVGRMEKGRMRSPWTQAYFLPQMRNADYHFRSPKGKKLQGTWETKYLVDDAYVDVDEWAERCWTEGAAIEWMQHVNVKVPDEDACATTEAMVRMEAQEMRFAAESQWAPKWDKYAMARGVCDGPFLPCVYQNLCYAPQPVVIEKNGLYVRRSPAYDVPQEVPA